jgi:hypothetical protein
LARTEARGATPLPDMIYTQDFLIFADRIVGTLASGVGLWVCYQHRSKTFR